jgi:RNA polymerase sigma factor (TIGR02999 family)
MSVTANVTDLLQAVNSGSQSARDELMDRLYGELRKLANSYLRDERRDHTLQPTALVHEVYLKLVGQPDIHWRNREHFIAVAATMMRRVLIDHARGHNRDKRGGGLIRVALGEADSITNHNPIDFVALDMALEKLAKDYPQEGEIVELRFFGGLSIADTARLLKVSESTVERDWRFARAWLMREMSGR